MPHPYFKTTSFASLIQEAKVNSDSFDLSFNWFMTPPSVGECFDAVVLIDIKLYRYCGTRVSPRYASTLHVDLVTVHQPFDDINISTVNDQHFYSFDLHVINIAPFDILINRRWNIRCNYKSIIIRYM